MTTLTMRYMWGHFIVTTPDIETVMFKSCHEAKDWCHWLHELRIQHGREKAGAAQADRTGRDASGGPSGCHPRLRHQRVCRHPSRGAIVRGGGAPGQHARRSRGRSRHSRALQLANSNERVDGLLFARRGSRVDLQKENGKAAANIAWRPPRDTKQPTARGRRRLDVIPAAPPRREGGSP